MANEGWWDSLPEDDILKLIRNNFNLDKQTVTTTTNADGSSTKVVKNLDKSGNSFETKESIVANNNWLSTDEHYQQTAGRETMTDSAFSPS